MHPLSNPPKATILILATLFVSLALAEDFKTLTGKVYKDATISDVETDGIVLRTKTGIAKVYFIDLPKEVQERLIMVLRRQLERQLRNASTRSKSPITPPRSFRVPLSLRALSKKSSVSENRSYRGNTRPDRQSRW